MKVTTSSAAKRDIAENIKYISDKGYPHNAEKLYDRMLAFIPTLGEMPEKYAICRNKRFGEKQYRCAVFEQSYLFVYAINKNSVLLLRVIHGLRLS
jgi:plasmid stabilization system protein ParE